MGPVLQISSMFICSLWGVKEPTHYSRRVGDEVPGVVAVLCKYTAILRKVVGKSARDNPERYCG